MKLKEIKTNECKVIVEPRYVGRGSGFSISGLSRSPREEYSLCEDIADGIKRHVDDVGNIEIDQKVKYIFEGEEFPKFDSIAEAMIYKFQPEDYDERYWTVSGGYGMNGSRWREYLYSFNEIVEFAYNNPYDFKIESGDKLTDKEMEIINKTVEYRMK